MKQAHVFISGVVQGVGFRYFVKNSAQQFGLTGWVRNTEDGGVEAMFCGEQKTIEKLIVLCKQGPFLAEVKQVGFEWVEPGQFEGFKIKE